MSGQCIAVVSGKGGTGKTSLTAGVGTALAQSGKRVLCMDCDIGLRNLDLALGLTDRALMDFSDVALDRCPLEAAVVAHPSIPNLYLLTAPVRMRGPAVTEEDFRRMLRKIRQQFDFCLLDAPAGLGAGIPTGSLRCRPLRGSDHTGCLFPAGRPAYRDGTAAVRLRPTASGGEPGAEEAAAQYARHH